MPELRIEKETPLKARLDFAKNLPDWEKPSLEVGVLRIKNYPTALERSHIFVDPVGGEPLKSGYIWVGATDWEAPDTSPDEARGPVEHYTTNQAGVNLIKFFEGFRSDPYHCAGEPFLTVGFGCTRIDGRAVKKNDYVSKEQAEGMLRAELKVFEAKVKQLVQVDLTRSEFSALTSFCYNAGAGALASSTLLKCVNNKVFNDVAAQFSRWIYGDPSQPPLAGLITRREAEGILFNTGKFVQPK